MRLRGLKRAPKEEAELDITSFMNLMIVLVPVLLMMMVFSRITVVELTLPGLSGEASAEDIKKEQLELEVTANGLDVFFPQGYLVQSIPNITVEVEGLEVTTYDFETMQQVLKQVKQSLLSKGVDKKNITLLLPPDADYQTIVSLIDHTRSYEDVLINSVVDAELFPEVSLADAPVSAANTTPTSE
ncbi:ExbD/TolR family protein [Glaciecola sp. 1036]|uniref:ExbD/TolR family protein n=1 Tax=Alteromonadaceae TaxID=72275 RepID=UPI003D031120